MDALAHAMPFQLPPESVEIILDLPFPPSTNSIWRIAKQHGPRGNVYLNKSYRNWKSKADTAILANRQYPRDNKIIGPFEVAIYLSLDERGKRRVDGDNRIKAILDWCQSRAIIADDCDCQKGRWEWVPAAEAPLGCRVHLRSLHG